MSRTKKKEKKSKQNQEKESVVAELRGYHLTSLRKVTPKHQQTAAVEKSTPPR
jgi:hypothetical protein